MRCLSIAEAIDVLATTGHSVTSMSGRNTLVLRPDLSSTQFRVGGSPPVASYLSGFADALIQWHESDRSRLVWIDNWGDLGLSAYAFVMAARAGLGETRSLAEAPGHYFDAHPYTERDQLAISAAHAQEMSLMIGFVAAMIMNEWDGWLLAEGATDRIEFWEGNILFYSDNDARMVEARSLLRAYGCAEKLH